MSTVKLVAENTDHPKVRAVFADIKATKQIDQVPNIWRALATHPEHLELVWLTVIAIDADNGSIPAAFPQLGQ